MDNQCDAILKHLERYPKEGITQMDAIANYGVMRLASRISDLRKMGYPIETERVNSRNRYGQPVSYARYVLREG